MEFLRWQWLIFFAPLFLTVLLALSAAIGLGQHESGVETPDVAEGDGLDAPGVEMTGVAHAGEHGNPFEGESVLSALGIGKVPLSIVLLLLLLLFGLVGILGNLMLGVGWVWVSLGLATVTSLVGTRYATRAIARVLPSTESHFVRRDELIGSEAIVMYPVTETGGMVRLYDRLKNFRQLEGRVYPGESSLPEHAKVVLMDYDATRQVFFVRAKDEAFK